MKEIHAYRNEDGTYRIECIGEVATEEKFFHGHKVAEETSQAIMEIARAKLRIEALVANTEGEIMTVVIGD
jgi:hypothetical protein